MRIPLVQALSSFLFLGWSRNSSKVDRVLTGCEQSIDGNSVTSEQEAVPESKTHSLQDLLIIARNGKQLSDLKNFLEATKGSNLQVILAVQFPTVDLVTIVTGKVENVRLEDFRSNSRLILRFKKFDESDLDLARVAINKITSNNPRHHKPPYSIYHHGDPIVEISSGDENCYEVRGMYLADEFLF